MKHLNLVNEIPNTDVLNTTEKPYVFATKDGTKVQYDLEFKQPMDYIEIAGIKWMRTNLGANSETEYGLYYPFGGIIGYYPNEEVYVGDIGSESYGKTFKELKKDGVIDENGNLTPEYDAVTQALGDGWKIPTTNEWQSLIDNTTYSWENNFNGSGVNGCKFALKDGSDYLFVPASGTVEMGYVSYVGYIGLVWSSSVNSSNNYNHFLSTEDGHTAIESDNSIYGITVRGVKTT